MRVRAKVIEAIARRAEAIMQEAPVNQRAAIDRALREHYAAFENRAYNGAPFDTDIWNQLTARVERFMTSSRTLEGRATVNTKPSEEFL